MINIDLACKLGEFLLNGVHGSLRSLDKGQPLSGSIQVLDDRADDFEIIAVSAIVGMACTNRVQSNDAILPAVTPNDRLPGGKLRQGHTAVPGLFGWVHDHCIQREIQRE